MKTSATSRHGLKYGFALVVTLSLMILLTVIAVGLLSLSAITLRSSNSQQALAVARANARMALILALGDLQKLTGPDQNITFPAALSTDGGAVLPNPVWTGVINVRNLDPRSKPQGAVRNWLVSGQNPDPALSLTKSASWNQGNAIKLATYREGGNNTDTELLAPVVNIPQGNLKGRFAWWIGDEGIKARVDLSRPAGADPALRERLTRSQSPMENGVEHMGTALKKLTPGGEIHKASLISIGTTALAIEQKAIPAEYFNDITAGGYGLPINVAASGMKADLSLIFDQSQSNKNFAATYFGVTRPSIIDHNGAKVSDFGTASDQRKFYLSETLSKDGSIATGPNWGILWNYATLWRNVNASQEMPLVGLNPTPWSNLRQRAWLPYSNNNTGTYQKDLQHTNSSVAPVISTLQIGFRLKSQLVRAASGSQPALYKAQVEIKPLLGIWNPYNVTISAAPYRFDWALYPFFRLNYARPNGQDSRLTRLWLRREWKAGVGEMPTPENKEGGRWFAMETPAVDIRPGEVRLFSVTQPVEMKSQAIQKLEAGWSEKGAFVVDLTYKTTNSSGKTVYLTREIPAGHVAWFGDIILQDTLAKSSSGQDDFDNEFPGFEHGTNASTWFTMKSGGNVLFRTTDLWTMGDDATVQVPEPVVSGWKGGSSVNTTKQLWPIEKIAGDGEVPHIATWSFFSRTTTQLRDQAGDQRLRGWVDANPRATVSQPAWDGSVARKDDRKGWHFTSQMMGGAHDPAPKGQVGDGNNDFPNRGLVSEGGSGEPEPQVADIKRYSGYSGASNTPTGQPNVVIYDVPRSPLVSIGQFQHAQLSRYNFEPGFIAGNSYANQRIPLDSTVARNFAGNNGLDIVDISYEVNARLWDGYFFSTLGLDYINASGTSFDGFFDLTKLASGEVKLPNPRMQFTPLPGDTTIDKILADTSSSTRGPEAIASRIRVTGAFNVNSTSKTAWKAFLSTMGASQLPTVTASGSGAWSNLSWNDAAGIRFNRFGHVLSENSYKKDTSGLGPEFWRGWRELSESELDALATGIVSEVKERGPFRSLAEFVNRNPFSSNIAHQRKGGLQAALDRTVNAGLPREVGDPARNPKGDHYSSAVSGESQAVGSAGYLMQGDVLQALAPVIQVRSDYFRIRTTGESVDAGGKVLARATCEAFVQRTPEFVDPADPAHSNFDDLKSKTNQLFGRRYEVVSFRWLADAEL